MSNEKKANFDFAESNYIIEKDKEDGVITITLDPALYELNRPEELTADLEKKVDAYRQDFTAAAITNAEALVAKAMKKDKELAVAVIKCDASDAYSFEATVQRMRSGFNPKTREPLNTYGSTVVRVQTAYRKIGPIKKACASMAERIREAVS